MPKLSCKCGTVINLSPIPSPYGFAVIAEAAMDDIRERLEALVRSAPPLRDAQRAIYIEVLGGMNEHLWQAYMCPACGRLYLFKKGGASQADAIWQLERGQVADLVPTDTRE